MVIENLSNFVADIKLAYDLGRFRNYDFSYDKIVFCGIGGSAAPGEVVKALNLKIPVLIARENLPDCVDEDTLCFVISYSGNTDETIKLYKQAEKKRCKIVIITSGGRLSKVKEEIILIPKGYLPREAFVYLLFPVLNILGAKYKQVIKEMRRFDLDKPKKLARSLRGFGGSKIPIIHAASADFRFLSYRWQTFLNENSKVFAHSNFYPEIAHNEIEARREDGSQVILLFDRKTKQVRRGSEITKPIEIKLVGKSLISKIIYGMYFGYMTSYYLAEILEIDHRKIERIHKLKK